MRDGLEEVGHQINRKRQQQAGVDQDGAWYVFTN